MTSDEIEKLVEDRIAKTEAYSHGYSVGKRDGYTQGRADALKELEQREREAFEAGETKGQNDMYFKLTKERCGEAPDVNDYLKQRKNDQAK